MCVIIFYALYLAFEGRLQGAEGLRLSTSFLVLFLGAAASNSIRSEFRVQVMLESLSIAPAIMCLVNELSLVSVENRSSYKSAFEFCVIKRSPSMYS